MTPLTRLDYYTLALAPAFYARLFDRCSKDSPENVSKLLITRQAVIDEARNLAQLAESPSPPREGTDDDGTGNRTA